MSKFAVGQPVRIVNFPHVMGHGDFPERPWNGTEAIVKEINGSDYDYYLLEVQGDSNYGTVNFPSENLEAVEPETKFKVGDRVTRFTDSNTLVDLEATVVKAEGDLINFVVTQNNAQRDVYPVGSVVKNRPASLYITLEERDERNKPAPLSPAVGDKVRYNNKDHSWNRGGYMPEGTVTERREGYLRVKWNTDKDNVTGSGFAHSSLAEEEELVQRWEKIEEFTPQRTFNFEVGDKVTFVSEGADYVPQFSEGDTLEIIERADNTTVSFMTRERNPWDYFAKSTETGIEQYIKDSHITEYVEPDKFAVGDTVKVVGQDGVSGGYSIGTVGTIVGAKDSEGDYRVRGNNVSIGSYYYHSEEDLEAHTPHPLDDAEVGTTMTLKLAGSKEHPYDYVMTKIADNKWRQVHVVYGFTQDMEDVYARDHYNDFSGKVLV